MKRRMLALLLSVSMLMTVFCVSPVSAAAEAGAGAPADAQVVQAPETDLQIRFWLEEGKPYYDVVSRGETLIEPSAMGLKTSIGEFNNGFTMGTVETSSGDETWSPVVGEQAEIRDYYEQASIVLEHITGIDITVELRAYDTGVAFRYLLPDVPEGRDSYEITDETTQFVFPAGAKANVHSGGNQTVPVQVAVENFSSSATYYRPMTIQYPSGAAMTICEANLDNYGVMTLKKDASAERALKANYVSYKPSRPSGSPSRGPEITVTAGSPTATPWRTFVIGESEIELPANSTIVENLNEAPDEETYHFSEWVDPGTCLRAASGMNTTAIKDIVDQAQERGIKYVLLDTGWYGPEYDVNCDPRLDPAALEPDKYESDRILLEQYFATEGGYNNTGEGVFNTRGKGFDVYKDLGTPGTFQTDVDIPAICDYANARDVGIILYVNGVYLPDSSGRDRYGAEELFTYFEKWGVKGVKPGFVHVRAQQFESYMQEVVEAAARHHLIMTVHDEYVPTGLQRTFPNLFCTEGILGDEGIGRNSDPQIAQDIATLFTRTIQGPADHTYCWPGKGTKAYALASPLLFRTGMNVLYWYTNPNSVPEQDKDKMDFWKDMPTTWAKSLYLEGKMYEYATYARQSKAGDWYVGSLSAIERTLQVPLDFLDEGVTYVADIYADGADADAYAGWNSGAKSAQTLENEQYLVTSETTLERDLKYGFGYAVKLTKATQEELETLPVYDVNRERVQSLLRQAEILDESSYTAETWAALQEAVEAANALLADDASTPEQLVAAAEALQQAIDGLRSKKALTEAIQKASVLTEGYYTPSTWSILEAALNEAERLLDAQQVSQAEIDEAAAELETAIEGLVLLSGLEVIDSTYLDTLDWESNSYAHANFISKNKSYGNVPMVLRINGEDTTFEHGVGTHAQSGIYYDISGMGFEVFEATVGVSAAKLDEKMGNVIFRVYGDGVLLYETEPVGYGANVTAQKIQVPIAGVKELLLEADTNGANSGDHANWADAQFVKYGISGLADIYVDGVSLPEYDSTRFDYYVPITEGQMEIPEVTVSCGGDVTAEVTPATSLPGTTQITVTTKNGELNYSVHFCTTSLADYLSDISYSDAVVHGGTVYRDVSYENNPMSVTAADGVSEMRFEKGLGAHAPANEVGYIEYDLTGTDYDRFQSWVGISYQKNDTRSTVRFSVYVDNETTPRFDSGVMGYRTPAKFVDLDIRGASKIRLQMDRVDNNSADHANWADAKFLSYEEIPEETGVALGLEAPETVAAGSEFEVKGTIGGLDALESPVAGLQMIMTYPEGMTCTEVTPNEAIKDDMSYSIHDDVLEVNFGYISGDLEAGLPVDLDSLFTAKFTASPDMAEGDYTFGLKDVMLSDWNGEEVPYTAEGASVHVTELPKEPQLLTVQWSGNASMSVEGEAEEIIFTDAIYGAKVQPGEELVFTFTPTDGAFSGAQLNGEDIEFTADGCTYTFTMPGESTTLRFTFTSVDKSILGIVLEEANAVPQDVIDSLVPSAKEFFENALAKAQEVYDDAAATEEEVKEAWSDLLDAMHLLEFEAGDKETLLPLINIAEQLKDMLDQFKPGTTEGFEEALDAAKDVYAEEDALKADVDEAYDNLQAAIDKLEMRADMSILQNTVDEANGLDLNLYIDDEAMAAFKTVLAEAEELLLNADAAQADVDAKAVELSNAMAALRKIPNKDELNKLIAEMEQKDLDGYTDRSVAAFKAALSVAKTVAADANADEQAVAKAYTNLEAAANNLVKAEKPSTGNSGKGSTSANIGNAYGAAGVVSAAQGVTSQKAYVVSDTTVNFNLKRGSAYCFKMTVVNGNAMTPSFTAGNGEVLKTQFVAKVGNDYYYRVYAIGTPGQSTGVYTTLPGQNAVKHCTVTIA